MKVKTGTVVIGNKIYREGEDINEDDLNSDEQGILKATSTTAKKATAKKQAEGNKQGG